MRHTMEVDNMIFGHVLMDVCIKNGKRNDIVKIIYAKNAKKNLFP